MFDFNLTASDTVTTRLISKVQEQDYEKTRCVCGTLMPPKHPSFEKHDPDI